MKVSSAFFFWRGKGEELSEKAKKSKPKAKAKISNKSKSGLTPKQELFCQIYASDREFFGNGTQSYIEAYGVDITKKGAYLTARVEASKLLTKPNILKRIDEIFEESGLNDQYVDKQLAKLIIQDADFKTKLGAIKEYNALQQRIAERQKKLDLSIEGQKLTVRLTGFVGRDE